MNDLNMFRWGFEYEMSGIGFQFECDKECIDRIRKLSNCDEYEPEFRYKQIIFEKDKLKIETEQYDDNDKIKGVLVKLNNQTDKCEVVTKEFFSLEAIFGIFDNFDTEEFKESCTTLERLLKNVCPSKRKKIDCDELEYKSNKLCDKEIDCKKSSTISGKPQLTVSIHISRFPKLFLEYFTSSMFKLELELKKPLLLEYYEIKTILDLYNYVNKYIDEYIMKMYFIDSDKDRLVIFGTFLYSYYIVFLRQYIDENRKGEKYDKEYILIKPRTLPKNLIDKIKDIYPAIENIITPDKSIIADACEFKEKDNIPFEITLEFRDFKDFSKMFIRSTSIPDNFSISTFQNIGVKAIRCFENFINNDSLDMKEIFKKEKEEDPNLEKRQITREKIETIDSNNIITGNRKRKGPSFKSKSKTKKSLKKSKTKSKKSLKKSKTKSKSKTNSKTKSKSKKSLKKSKTKSKSKKSLKKSKTNSKTKKSLKNSKTNSKTNSKL